MKIYQTDDVFGLIKSPLNYVKRDGVDDVFIRSLTQQKHIVLHGSSKQGKTVLRKRWLPSSQTIVVQCMKSWDLATLHAAVLKEAGFTVLASNSTGANVKITAQATFGGGFNLPLVGKLAAEGKAGTEAAGSRLEVRKPLDLDLSDPNDIIRALQSVEFNQFITLEDFHYLPEETQKDFAFALKAYHERSTFLFLVVGVWLERDRLAVYNGDLTGRLASIDVDQWPRPSLFEVIREGEVLLNVEFSDDFKEDLVANCLESVYIVQEVCNRALLDAAIYHSSVGQVSVPAKRGAKELIRVTVDRDSARYNSFLTSFAEGFRDTHLQMYRWILLPVLSAPFDELEKGLPYRYLRKLIQKYHPEGTDLKVANIAFALKAVASLQVKHSITPLILDYDLTANMLHIVDRGFLVWLRSQGREALLERLDLPVDALSFGAQGL